MAAAKREEAAPMEWLLLIAFAPLLLMLSLQLLLLRLTRRRARCLRWAPLLLLSVPLWGAVACWLDGGWFWQLGVALVLGIGATALTGWGRAWGVCALRRRKGVP